MVQNSLCRLMICFTYLLFISCKGELEKRTDAYLLLDTAVPDLEPKIFATDIISKLNRFEQYPSFSPDGKSFYFSYTDSIWGKSTMIQVCLENPVLKQETIHLANSDYQSGQFVDYSGEKLFFTAVIFSDELWQADIFQAKKTDRGWEKVKKLGSPVNSYICEWHPTLTKNGVMYFASERNYDHGIADIYRAFLSKGVYSKVEKLSSVINTEYNETDPLIAPDESFLIFASNRPGGVTGPDIFSRPNGYDELDLYISFNKGNNNWSAPKNMGHTINTDSWEFAPALSPDGKFLFFTRREAFNTLNPSKIYWVDSKIINRLRE
jgi:hypothetical protein